MARVAEGERTLDRLEALAADAAERGARLVVFPEAFVPAYPASSVFGPVFGGFSDPRAGPAFRRLAVNSGSSSAPAARYREGIAARSRSAALAAAARVAATTALWSLAPNGFSGLYCKQ